VKGEIYAAISSREIISIAICTQIYDDAVGVQLSGIYKIRQGLPRPYLKLVNV
jgi:hypothetical protein